MVQKQRTSVRHIFSERARNERRSHARNSQCASHRRYEIQMSGHQSGGTTVQALRAQSTTYVSQGQLSLKARYLNGRTRRSNIPYVFFIVEPHRVLNRLEEWIIFSRWRITCSVSKTFHFINAVSRRLAWNLLDNLFYHTHDDYLFIRQTHLKTPVSNLLSSIWNRSATHWFHTQSNTTNHLKNTMILLIIFPAMTGAPKIVGSRTSKDLSIIEHQPVALECQVSGVPDPAITWTRDGIKVLEEEGRLRIVRGGRLLQMKSSRVNDTGVYVCTALNVAGADQRQYRLNVMGMWTCQ